RLASRQAQAESIQPGSHQGIELLEDIVFTLGVALHQLSRAIILAHGDSASTLSHGSVRSGWQRERPRVQKHAGIVFFVLRDRPAACPTTTITRLPEAAACQARVSSARLRTVHVRSS